jgi:2-C-methyl-D-erythritol 4-phosphate cytidylyltransferase
MYALIVAAGSGSRMQSDIPKQFLSLKGKPVLYYTLETFCRFHAEMKIILVSNPEYSSYIDDVLHLLQVNNPISVVRGGATRFESVRNGLAHVPDHEIVFIHDGVRPFVTDHLLDNCYQTALREGNAIPAVPIKDSIRQIEPDGSVPLDRSILRGVQTPQTFKSELIKKAYQAAQHMLFTDDATVLETFGEKIMLVSGEDENIKLTTPLDLIIAEELLLRN